MITAVTLCVLPTARASRHPRPYHGGRPCPLPAGVSGRNRPCHSAISPIPYLPAPATQRTGVPCAIPRQGPLQLPRAAPDAMAAQRPGGERRAAAPCQAETPHQQDHCTSSPPRAPGPDLAAHRPGRPSTL